MLGSADLPQFFIAGAPKAGTTALHAALSTHPDLFLSAVKEPKYYLCDGAPPDPAYQRGPGDAHSSKEWVWRRDHYKALFAPAPPGTLRGESTPFYLYDRAAHMRIAKDVPDARIIVVVRDPVDRAYSNWMHLWSDGLETESSFIAAVRAEESRIAEGYAPFWHYRGMGRYGEQLRDLYQHFSTEQVLVLRYRHLVDDPVTTLDRVSTFLGVRTGQAHAVAPENVKPFVADSIRRKALSPAVRLGAAVGQHLPPRLWRQVSRPIIAALHAGGAPRPHLSVQDRREVLGGLLDDIALLEEQTGESFADWRQDSGRGEFRSRQAAPTQQERTS